MGRRGFSPEPPLHDVDLPLKSALVDLGPDSPRESKVSYQTVATLQVYVVEMVGTLLVTGSTRAKTRSAFPSKESATSTGQPHLKKVASLTSSGLDKTEYKGKACDEKPASGGWFSYRAIFYQVTTHIKTYHAPATHQCADDVAAARSSLPPHKAACLQIFRSVAYPIIRFGATYLPS